MPTWKKVIVSGSQAHLQGITASNLTSTQTPQVVGYNPTTGVFSYFSTSSIALPTTIDGVGVGQRLAMWSDSNTITTSSIVMTTEANPRFIVGYTDTAGSPVFTGRLNVSGSSGNEGIVVGSRVSTDVNSYGTYVFSDTEGPKIGFGSYTVAAATTPLSASWAQIGVYNQALRFEAFTTGSHVLSGGILFSYSGSNRPDLKISASNGATLVGINTNTPTNTLQVNGGITAVNITASGNISSSAGLIGQTLTTSGGANVGGNVVVTGDLAVNSTGTGITAVNITASNNLLVSNNLIVNGNTTLGDASGDSVTVNAQTVTLSNPLLSTANVGNILVLTSSNRIATQSIDTRVFGTSLVDATNGVDNRIATFTDANSLNGESNLTFDGTTFAVSTGFTATAAGVVNAASVTTTGDVVVGGNLTVNGDTTIINTSTISIEDKFIILGRSSGSQAPASEGGIIVEGAAGSGSAFVFNSGSAGVNGLSNRWGVALGVPTGSSDITPTDFMVTVSGSAANPIDTSAPTFGSSSFGFGNMHVNTSTGEIWIWS